MTDHEPLPDSPHDDRDRADACAIRTSPFTMEELHLLDRLRTIKEEWRSLSQQLRERTAGEPAAPQTAVADDVAALLSRLREVEAEAERLRARAEAARRRRMIALGHIDDLDEPLVSLDELRRS